MTWQAVKWAMDDAPMLLTDKGKPDTTARHVLAALAERASATGRRAYPSLLDIQYRTGYDRRTVQRALRRLEDAGLITADGVMSNCTIYHLSMHLMRPESDRAGLEAEEMLRKEGDARRQAKARARRVTHADDVTVTDSGDVTDSDVTHSASVSHVVEVRDVTDSASRRHARNAAQTITEPSVERSGNLLAGGRRPTTGSTADSPSGFAAPQEAAPTQDHTADIRAVVAALPVQLRTAVEKTARFTPPLIANTIRAELLRGIPVQRLIDRAEVRWHDHGYAEQPAVKRPVGVAVALLRNDCTSARCDDGIDIDTDQKCRTCERAREDHLTAE